MMYIFFFFFGKLIRVTSRFYPLSLFFLYIQNERNQSFLAPQIIWHKQNHLCLFSVLGHHLRMPYWNLSIELSEEGNVAVYSYSVASRMSALTPSEREHVSCSVVSHSLRPHQLKPTRFLCPWNSPGKTTGVGSHSLLQGIFLTQEVNMSLPHCRQILDHLDHLSHQGIVSVLKPFGNFFFFSVLVLLLLDFFTLWWDPGKMHQKGKWVECLCPHSSIGLHPNPRQLQHALVCMFL